MFKQGQEVNIKISFWSKLAIFVITGTWCWVPNEGIILRWDESLLAYEVAVGGLGEYATWYVVPEKLEAK